MQLHKLLSAAGILMFWIGAAAADSDIFFAPAGMFLLGLALMVWAAYEEGFFKRGGRK